MKRLLLGIAVGVQASTPLDPARIHLVDAYPREAPRNFLFRGNNPVDNKNFSFDALVAVLRQKALAECNATFPDAFRMIDLDFENLSDPGYFVENSFWADNPDKGELRSWPILGSLEDVKHPARDRDELVRNGSWAIQGSADYLPERLNATRELLTDTRGPPTILYAHCNAGCDRTGEFIGAYAMSHLGYNVTTAVGEACKQCGRCSNYFAMQSIGWWCLTLQAEGRTDLGDCLDAFGCKNFSNTGCAARNPTPLDDDCPRA